MLQHLHIENYAIIEKLEISFGKGLNIITGETGAGKSILMGALNLVLGQRADTQVLMHADRKCIVEALFIPENKESLTAFFNQHDLDEENQVRIRREITANGKSRSFVNDTPVNLSQLKALSRMLVDLHQQFDTLDLGNEDFQREALDVCCGHAETLSALKTQFARYQQAKNALDELRSRQTQANRELDYNQFLFDELDALNLLPDEMENLEAESKLLSHAETVKQQLSSVYRDMKEGEQPALQQLKLALNRLRSLTQFHPDIESLTSRLQSTFLELEDIVDELERIDENIDLSAERLAKINDRLSAGYTLFKKHGVNNTAALIGIREGLEQKLNSALHLTGDIQKLKKKQPSCMTSAWNWPNNYL